MLTTINTTNEDKKMSKPFTFIGVSGYGGSLRDVSVSVFAEDRTMIQNFLSPEDARELARLLLCAARDAEGEVIVPDSYSMSPKTCARIVPREEGELA
jgi:hypothetical protein